MIYKAFIAVCLFVLTSVSAHASDELKGVALSDETKKLIETYRKNPTKDVEDALRKRVEMSYDKMLARKRSELQTFKKESKDTAEIDKMQKDIDELVKQRKSRVNKTMMRLSGKPEKLDTKKMQNYLPVRGAAKKISVAYAPVTNEEYALFISQTKHKAPQTWQNGTFPAKKGDHPVTDVSYKDAVAYCEWLTKIDGKHLYRLPTEREWEQAAGPMPEDADINCKTKGTTSIKEHSKTLSAAGAVDMWGNVWEWTSTSKSTLRGILLMNVKGCSWAASCSKCYTDYRGEAREPRFKDDALGFRVVRED